MKLNDGKTEFLNMGTTNNLKKVSFNNIKIGHVQISAAKKAKSLRVFWMTVSITLIMSGISLHLEHFYKQQRQL